MASLDVSVEEISNVRRCVRIQDTEVFYDYSGDVDRPAVVNLDFAVVAAIFYAMKHNRDIHVHGPVSKSLLRNIEEFQAVWSCWCPQNYAGSRYRRC
jgi:hypothetical protein